MPPSHPSLRTAIAVLFLLAGGACLSAPEGDDDGEDDDSTPGDDDDATGDDDATADDDTADDDTTPVSDDDTTPVSDDDSAATDDDVTPGDDDTSSPDDDSAASDDDTSLPDDDTTPEPTYGILEGVWYYDGMWLLEDGPGLAPGSFSYEMELHSDGLGDSMISGHLTFFYNTELDEPLCEEQFSLYADHEESTVCSDCLGVVKNFSFVGPFTTTCDLPATSTYDDSQLESLIPPHFYSDVLDLDDIIGDTTFQYYVDAEAKDGHTVIYEVYANDGGGSVVPFGYFYY